MLNPNTVTLSQTGCCALSPQWARGGARRGCLASALWRHGGEGDAAGQTIANGRDRHAGVEKARGARRPTLKKLRVEIYDKVNQLGIGAQGLGGLTTVLDVKIVDWPTHAANLPVAMIPNCAATRHAHVVLDGSGPAYLEPPNLESWPKLTYDVHGGKRVNLDTLTREEIKTWKPGEVLLLNGKLLTGRDAAHKRMTDMLNRGEKLPVDFTNRIIYYVGPVDPVHGEVVGPALGQRLQRAWINSRGRCWNKQAYWAWSARLNAVLRRLMRFAITKLYT